MSEIIRKKKKQGGIMKIYSLFVSDVISKIMRLSYYINSIFISLFMDVIIERIVYDK